MFYTGGIGLRSRTDPRHRRALLARHARLGPLLFVLMLASWLGGVASTWLGRSNLEIFRTTHFRMGTVLIVAVTGAYLTSRRMHLPSLRAAHPWLGAAAMLLAAAQAFFGLQIAP